MVKPLNESSQQLIDALPILATYPFPQTGIKQAIRGDYLNAIATLDLTVRRFGENVFTTSALDPNMKHLSEILTAPDFMTGAEANLSGQAADPFKISASAVGAERLRPDIADADPIGALAARGLRRHHRLVHRCGGALLPHVYLDRWDGAPTRSPPTFAASGGIYQECERHLPRNDHRAGHRWRLTDTSASTPMRLDTDTSGSRRRHATVKSVSAIGEQYVDLTPDPTHRHKCFTTVRVSPGTTRR